MPSPTRVKPSFLRAIQVGFTKGLLPLALWLPPGAAEAQVVRNFDVRFETRDNGDIHHLGNTMLTCPDAVSSCAGARAGTNPFNNNDYSMVRVDVDGDATTTTSSSADLALSVDQTVLWAGLYWGSESTSANRYDVKFRTPATGTYVPLTATQQDIDATNTRYSGFVDVTALVQAGGAGTYWVADVEVTTGGNKHGGWTIIVVTADPNDPLRSLQVFDGYARVTPTSSASMTASGLIVPPSGPVNTRMGTIVYEGDLGFTGDELRLNGIQVGDTPNPTDNFHNSVISRLGNHITTKNPDYRNQLGYDATYVDVSAFAAIPNGSTSATIDLSTTGDWYYPAAVSFATDLHSPEIQPTFSKTITDVNGAPAAPGDTLEYLMSFANTGDDAAINVVMTDTVPSSVSFAAGSLTVVSGANAGAKSDTPGNDQADFDGSVSPAGEVVFRLGTGADGVSGGRIAPGDSTSVRFRVVIDSTASDGTTVTSRSHVAFDAETSGINGLSAVSNDVITTVVTQSDLSVVMTGPGSALLGDTLVYEVVTTNGGPQSATDVVVTDTLPAGLSFVSATRGASHSSGAVTWPAAPLSSGASLTDSVTVVTAIIGTHTNLAAATSSSSDPDPSNSDGSSPASQQTTLVESDTDGDGVPDATDDDDDGDGIPDATEGDGTVDTDNDGIPDSRDTDSDDDGILDIVEAQGEGAYIPPADRDNDGDGLDDAYDSDDGGTPITPVNTDSASGDTVPDYLDTDSDGDGVPDSVEGHDADMDGQPDRTPTGDDDDNDGLDNAYDPDDGGTNAPLQDTDSDSVRDWRDTDDDGDGDPTDTEDTDGNGDPTDDDSDGDGIPDYLDPPEAVDLAARKEAVGDFRAGDTGVFRIVATNVGSTPTVGTITVVDTLPGGLNYQSASGVGFSVTNAGQVITGVHPGPIAVGDSVVLTINVGIDADLAGDFVNRATVSTPRDPGTDSNNTATTLPVPVIAPSPMMLEKGTTRLEAEIGDMVSYSLRLANVDDAVLTDVSITDRLPAGFSYLPGSAQRNQVAVTDPAGTPGPELTFDIGELGPQESVLITYSVRVGVGAQLGDGVNRAQARSSSSAATSNEAAIKVQVRAGAFSDDAFVAGKVFASGDGSLVQGAEALGVPGVRVYLQDGTSAVTDSEGKFSFFGLRPRLYVVRVDQSTLPPGARLAPISNRHSEDGRTLFVDLTRGELHRADFAETSGDPSVWQSIKVRRARRDSPGQMFGDGRVDRSGLRPGSELPLDMFGLEEEPTLTSATSGLPSGSNESVFRWQSQEAGSGVSLHLVDGGVPADGQTTVPVRVSVRSESGLPTGTSGEDEVVTLETTRGTWVSPDADPVAPGYQLRLEGGAGEAQLQTPIGGGPATVRASRVIPADGGQVTEADEGTLNFTTRARSVLMTGLIEGRMDLRSLQQGRLLEGGRRDRFDDALRSFAFGGDNGRWTGGLRASAFATGEVTDNTRVTLRLDSEVDPRSRLFNDIRPDELYTVYGDASPRIYEAQSKGRFYGLVERGSNYLQFGDFTTAGVGGRANVLGRYSRTLNGLMSHWEQGRGSVDAFVSRDRFRQVVDEIPARGISGPYSLSRVDGLFNSERVELVTRDRTQPAVILSVQPMQRFTDYTIEPFSGRIVFRRPIASLDAQLNPVTIRVSYELEQGGDAFMTYGLAGQFSATDRLALGASVIRDSNPLGSYGISSLNADFGLGTGTRLAAEVAVSDSADVTSGLAYRLMLQHVTQGFEVSGFIQDSDTTFMNRSAGVGIGRREVGITARRVLDHRTQLFTEAVRTESRLTSGYVQGATLGMERRLSEFFSAEVGYRWANRSGAAPLSAPVASQLVDVSALRLRLTGRSPSREASLFTEYEQDLTDASLKRLEVGGDWRILDRARVYARHELMSSFAGPYALNAGERLNQTVFGVSADYMAGAHIFSEYRARDAFDGRQAHAAMGLRNEWMLRPGLGIGASFERIDPLTASSSIQRSLALGGSVEYTANPLWRGTVRGEYRASAAEDQLFGTLGFARKLSRDWSLLGQSVWSHVLDGGATFGRTRTGVAYRSTDTNRWNALARYEHRLDEGGALSGTGDILGQRRRGAHVLSAHSSFSPTNSTVLALQAATKFANENLNGITLAESAHLLSTRVTRDLVQGWDVGAMGRTLFNGDFSERQFGLGLEVGRVVRDNFRVAVGYNAFGFTDQDLTSDLPTDHGLYVDVGFAFDEGLFGFGRRTETPVEAGGGGGSTRRYEAPSPSTDALNDWSEASMELAGCTGSRCGEEPESATALAEVEDRTTDERIAGDLDALTELRDRLAALPAPGDSTQLHNRVEARAMVDLAEVEYTDNDQTGIADAVRGRAESAVLAAEGGVDTELPTLPYDIQGAPTTRTDFWDRIQDVRDSYGFKCAARPLAQSTVRLVWAGNEERTFGERIPSHEGRAEVLLLEAEEAASRCKPEMMVEPEGPEFTPIDFHWDAREALIGPPLEPGPVGSTRLGLRRKEQGELVMVVRFDFGGDWLTEEARRYLDTAIRIYGSAEGLEVVGHTDAQGEEDFNMRLGRARAETVADYLRGAGAAADKIDITSMGETAPIEEGDTEEAHALNRRVEIRVRQAPSE